MHDDAIERAIDEHHQIHPNTTYCFFRFLWPAGKQQKTAIFDILQLGFHSTTQFKKHWNCDMAER